MVSVMTLGLGGWSTASAAGPDPRLFTAAESPGAIFGVDTPRVVGHLKPFVALGFDTANDELVSVLDGTKTRLLSQRSTWDFAAGFGVTDRLELALAVPVQAIVAAEGSAIASDVGDLRLRAKVRLLGGRAGEPGFGVGLLAEFGFPTGGDTRFAGAGGFSGTFAALASYALAEGPVFAAMLGARGRGVARVDGLAIGSELRWGLGIDVPLIKQLALMGELEGAFGLESPDQFPIEARFGARMHVGGGVSVALAGGAGVTEGYGSPDWRVVVGLSWVYGGATPAVTLAPKELTPAERLRQRTGKKPDPQEPDPNAPAVPTTARPMDLAAFDNAADLDPDPDQDGVLGELDSCPAEHEDVDGYGDIDGCPDPDNDGDGILDDVDKCVEAAETINGVDDYDGCPDGEAPTVIDLSSPELAQAIAFESGSDVLQEASEAPLRQIASILRATGPKTRVRIEGHTDSQGDPEFNVDLSERRAIRVRMQLIALGVPPERMVAKGFGATRIIAKENDEAGRQRNRRVMIVPLYEDSRPRPGGGP
jgi:outer membrane protein OmpA-like peptidoglycan-associated protein